MGKKLGHDGYIPLGYDRMMRNCYGKDDVERFRAAVREYIVPIAGSVYAVVAKRLGKTLPMGYADCAMWFRGRQRQAHRHAGGDTRRRAQFLPRAERGDGGVHRLHAG